MFADIVRCPLGDKIDRLKKKVNIFVPELMVKDATSDGLVVDFQDFIFFFFLRNSPIVLMSLP
jgi:hypothetical protein